MSDDELIAEIQNKVLRVTINRANKRNALSRAVLSRLKSVFEQHASNGEIVAAVLTGAGDKCFAAGGDLRDLNDLRTEADGREMALGARSALDSIRRFPVPVIAALNGDALGGGAELAASCDFRIMAKHARIGFIQGRLAISTAWGGGIDLFRIVGGQIALRLLTSAKLLSAEEARQIGLVDDIAQDRLEDVVNDFLEPALSIAPQVHRAFKALANATTERTRAEEVELRHFAQCWAHEDHWKAHDNFMGRVTS